MFTHYIYSLTIRGRIVYVGTSKNPAKRLQQHIQESYQKLGAEFKSISGIADVSINILQVVRSKTETVNKDVSQIEHYWINKCIIDGHPLCNVLIKAVSNIRLKKYKEALKNG